MAGVKRFHTPTEVQNLNGTGSTNWRGGNPYRISNLKQKYVRMSKTKRTTCCAEGQNQIHFYVNCVDKVNY